MSRYFLKRTKEYNQLIVCENDKQVNFLRLVNIFQAVPKSVPVSQMPEESFREVTIAEMLKNKKLRVYIASYDTWHRCYNGDDVHLGVKKYVSNH